VTSERELKIAVDDPADLRRRLHTAGARLRHAESFEDNEIWDRAGELRAAGCLLRLRRDGHGARLTFKGPATFDGALKIRDEHETAVGDADRLAQILAALGYAPVRRYQKYREEWALGDVVVAVDRTPLGWFVEFEGEEAAAAAAHCGCDPEQALLHDYLTLWAAHRRSHPAAPADMVFGSEKAHG
jgi:adenylate cyclase class 2